MLSIKRVTDGRNFHEEITETKPFATELLPEVPIYCKILCKERVMPAAVKFEFKSKGNMNIYLSCKHLEPSFGDCEMRASGRPARMLYYGKDHISTEHQYFEK